MKLSTVSNPKTVALLLGRILVVSVVAVLLLAPAASCVKRPPPFTEIEEPTYARTILEKVLAAWKEDNYDAFLEYKHPSMLIPDSRKLFEARVASVKANFGDYVAGSAEFSDASFQYNAASRLGLTVVHYNTAFTKESRSVLIELTFENINGKVYVFTTGVNTRGQFY